MLIYLSPILHKSPKNLKIYPETNVLGLDFHKSILSNKVNNVILLNKL